MRAASTAVVIVAAILVLGAAHLAADDLPAEEVSYRALFSATPIDLAGTIMDDRGRPLSGATVELEVLGTITASTTTGFDGSFELTGLDRANRLLRVTASGHRETVHAVHLFRPLELSRVELPPILLSPVDPTVGRFLFGGDVSFGRRFIDPDGVTPYDQMPPDDPDALILVSDPLPGSEAAVDFIRPLFQAADFGACNLESPVLDDPSTPHPFKDWVFFTLPGSLPALSYMGVDYVGLGNNHLFDYLDAGISATLSHLAGEAIPASGAGLDSTAAYQGYRTVVAGSPYSLVAATSVSGSQWPEGYDYLAAPDKAGAADLRDSSALNEAVSAEIDAGYLPILQLHTGLEYSFEPSDYATGRFALAAESGAALVIGHHPHVAQGFDFDDGVFITHSLGNFIFDQDRLETLLGAVVDLEMDGASARRIRAHPVYLEDYRPRPIAGPLADVFLRRLGEFSRGGAVVFPYNHVAWVSEDSDTVAGAQSTVQIAIDVPAEGSMVVDLSEHMPSTAWPVSAQIAHAGITGSFGRDLLDHGSFEDQDVDDEQMEISRWDVSGTSSFPCLHRPYRGTVALCSVRNSGNVSDSVIPFRNRIRVMGDSIDQPNKDLSLFGYVRASNAGDAKIVARYYASVGDNEFGEEDAFVRAAGSSDWVDFAVDLAMPADPPGISDPDTEAARAVRLFIRQSPPVAGDGMLSFDELAVISWEAAGSLEWGLTAENTPNAFRFLRIQAPPGQYQLTVTVEELRPAAATATIFTDGFESGDTTRWSGSVP